MHIATVLRATDDKSLFTAFSELWGGAFGDKVAEMPPRIRRLRLTDSLVDSLRSESLGFFLKQYPDVLHLPDLAAFLDEIGAKRASACVAELLKLLPRGRPDPSWSWPQFEAHVEKLEEGRVNPFPPLEARYRDAIPEIARALRAYLAKHAHELDAELVAARGEVEEPPRRSLEEVLRISAADDFPHALIEWLDEPPGVGKLGFEGQPATGRMLWVMVALSWSLARSGTRDFLDSIAIGEHVSRLPAWADALGATVTAEYARELVAIARRMKMPAKDPARRAFLRGALGEGQPLQVTLDTLDGRYRRRVARELPGKVKAFVKENRARLEKEAASAGKKRIA